MRLGFHYHIPAVNDTGTIRTMGFLGRFIDSLAVHCDHVVCFQHTPTLHEQELMDYALSEKNVTLIEIGPHHSVPKRILDFPKTKRLIIPYRNQLDAVLIRGPSPLLPAIARVFEDLPTALLIVGDYTTNMQDLPQPWWRKELIRIWSAVNKYQQIQVAKKCLTFVNNRKLYEEFQRLLPNLIETRTTTLSADDYYERQDTCQSAPYHLLYSGRIDRAKGLADMIEALALLAENNEYVILDCVGWANKDDQVVGELNSLAQTFGVNDRVKFHGYKPIGPELFAYYKKADIYVIASRGSEGFPRTIWEAMAYSLPVIATSVGSIPSLVMDSALIIPPSNPIELAQAISKLIASPDLRQALIAKGRLLAKGNTLEFHTRRMIIEINRWVTHVAPNDMPNQSC